MMPEFQPDEMTLMALYDTGTREGLIAALKEMRPYMDADETALQDMTDAVLEKLDLMTDERDGEWVSTERRIPFTTKPWFTRRWPRKRRSRSPAATNGGPRS